MSAPDQLCFVDSNIWLYALLDMQEETKHIAAVQLIEQDAIVISSQVINEVCRNLLKAGNFTEADITEYILTTSYVQNTSLITHKPFEESMCNGSYKKGPTSLPWSQILPSHFPIQLPSTMRCARCWN